MSLAQIRTVVQNYHKMLELDQITVKALMKAGVAWNQIDKKYILGEKS